MEPEEQSHMALKRKATTQKNAAAKKPTTKSETLSYIAEKTGLTRKDVGAVFDAMGTLMRRDLRAANLGAFTVPGLMKVKVKKIPARRARKNVPNPFKPGELMDVAARPARKTVKVTPLKALKDMV